MSTLQDQPFDVFHPDWRDWVAMLEWHLMYSEPLTVEEVMSALVTQGFILTPPARKRYRVEYNGKLIFEMDTLGNVAHLGPYYEITDTREEETK